MSFIAAAPVPVLESALHHLPDTETKVQHERGLALVLGLISSGNPIAIGSALTDSSALVRRYAASAAARLASTDAGPLHQAMRADDEAIRRFASDMAARIGLHGDAQCS